MADRDSDPVARIAPGFAAIDAGAWDRLAGEGDPFLSHRFLSLLESSGSIGEGSAVAAAPAFLKGHSQGEYVFDHGWADAWQRAGHAYYPKLQVAVPFTPVPGQRLLGSRPEALLGALRAVTAQFELSSAHVTFCTPDEAALAETHGWLVRHGLQFHWFNRDYASFDDFLAALSSRKRKVIRKERAAAVAELEILTLRGAEILPIHWDAMWHFYQDTGQRKWGQPYLTPAFFEQIGAVMGDDCLMFLALRDRHPIAGALNFVGADTLFGRYWGASEEVDFLHFELSYYRAIEWAIASGLKTVQAGAQGEHKLARGYEPVRTYSVHHLPDLGFRRAVADFLVKEREGIEAELAWARAASPYRSAGSA